MKKNDAGRMSIYRIGIVIILGFGFIGAGCTNILPSQENGNKTTNVNTEASTNVNANSDDPCSKFTEDQCFTEPTCQGIYGPSACQGSICTADITYKGCRSISEDILDQAEKDETRCKQTEGTWVVNSYNKPGSCDCGSDLRFDSAEGCIQ